MQSVSILYEMCTNKYNVPGCEYQVQVEAPPGGFDALGIRSNAHPPPWPAVQRQCGKNHFICEMISYEIACTAIKNKTYPTRPTHHPDLQCGPVFAGKVDQAHPPPWPAVQSMLLKRQWAKTFHLWDDFIQNLRADRTKQKHTCYRRPTWTVCAPLVNKGHWRACRSICGHWEVLVLAVEAKNGHGVGLRRWPGRWRGDEPAFVDLRLGAVQLLRPLFA
jgi:hypothetical protein